MMSTCSAMVAMTANSVSGSNSVLEAPGSPADARSHHGKPKAACGGDLAPHVAPTVEHEGRTLTLELLRDGAQRPVGWLVRAALG